MEHVSLAHAFEAVPALLASPLAWLERHRQRQELKGVLGMPDYLLKDIGLQRHEIAREAFKPVWRP